MRVSELIELLEDHNPEALVIMAGDPEGNDYYTTPVTVDGPLYINEEGEVGFNSITPELEEQGYTDEDLIIGEECVVLIP